MSTVEQLTVERNAARAELAALRRQLAEIKEQSWTHANLYLDANAALRRQLAAVPRDDIAQLYDAYAYATAGADNAEQFPAVGIWLGVL